MINWRDSKKVSSRRIGDGTSYILGGNRELLQPLWKTVITEIVEKSKIELLSDPVIPLLSTYPDKTKL